MDEGSRSAIIARVRAFCARPGSAVLFDETGPSLLDVPSGKVLPLPLSSLRGVEEKQDAQTGKLYLRLEFGDGRQLALTAAGVAFAALFANTGPLPELPPAVCWSDFSSLLGKLKHELYGHPDREPTRDTAKLLLCCIAVLDGARAAGFEVGPEEQDLEANLRELEKRAPPAR
ncbi:MAG: hypothetical protein ACYC8T_25385 [Myxococcaceae bacterium]